MAKRSSSKNPKNPKANASQSSKKRASKPKTAAAGQNENAEDLTEKQQMVEKLFRHTNDFLEANKHDPLLVVEALAAILVRYTALLGPVAQIADRLAVLERLIRQESTQIQEIANSATAEKKAKKP